MVEFGSSMCKDLGLILNTPTIQPQKKNLNTRLWDVSVTLHMLPANGFIEILFFFFMI